MGDVARGTGGVGFDSRDGQIGHNVATARLRCNVSPELCCAGSKPQRCCTSLLVTYFSVILRG